eukprot:ANDGO_06935.mRNA.1 hypothetical protein
MHAAPSTTTPVHHHHHQRLISGSSTASLHFTPLRSQSSLPVHAGSAPNINSASGSAVLFAAQNSVRASQSQCIHYPYTPSKQTSVLQSVVANPNLSHLYRWKLESPAHQQPVGPSLLQQSGAFPWVTSRRQQQQHQEQEDSETEAEMSRANSTFATGDSGPLLSGKLNANAGSNVSATTGTTANGGGPLLSVWSNYRETLRKQYAASRSPFTSKYQNQQGSLFNDDTDDGADRNTDHGDAVGVSFHGESELRTSDLEEAVLKSETRLSREQKKVLPSWQSLLNHPASSAASSASAAQNQTPSYSSSLKRESNSPPRLRQAVMIMSPLAEARPTNKSGLPAARPSTSPQKTSTSPQLPAQRNGGVYSTPGELMSFRSVRHSKVDDLTDDFPLSDLVRLRGKLVSLSDNEWKALPAEFKRELTSLAGVIQSHLV